MKERIKMKLIILTVALLASSLALFANGCH
jgi:hypothetical protein